MTVFGKDYSESYDKIYKQKDYDAEVQYLTSFFSDNSIQPPAKILDLGCGTGEHAIRLADQGYELTGVDRSSHMLEYARQKFNAAKLNANFVTSDLKDFSLNVEFDAVICMFAVLGYVTDTNHLLSALKNIAQHLKPGGLLMFDCWHGNAVLSEKPSARVAKFTMDGKQFERSSSTRLDIQANVGEVDFLLAENGREMSKESHAMRYFFIPEIKFLLELAGFSEVQCFKFLLREIPAINDWNLFVSARKKI